MATKVLISFIDWYVQQNRPIMFLTVTWTYQVWKSIIRVIKNLLKGDPFGFDFETYKIIKNSIQVEQKFITNASSKVTLFFYL